MNSPSPNPPPTNPPDWAPRAIACLARWAHRPLILAVSGGADSVALLRLAAQAAPSLNLHLAVAHLHHHARPDADADAHFVAQLAHSLHLPFHLGHWAPHRPHHFEADARRARYHWLAQLAQRLGTPAAIATAHTRDDHAETILHRILRGTGPRGLTGIPRHRTLAPNVSLIRPLLHTHHNQLTTFLHALNQPWREDPTNLDTRHTRAHIRHILLPTLAQNYNPRIADALIRLARQVHAQHRWIERLANRLARQTFSTSHTTLAAPLPPLRSLHPTLRSEVLRAAWRHAGWPQRAMSHSHWLRLTRLIHSKPSSLHLPGPILAHTTTDQLFLQRLSPTPPPPEPTPEPPG